MKNHSVNEFKSFEEDELIQKHNVHDDDENPHLHLHLLTHPKQQSMHIRCTDKICSNCANIDPSSSAEIQTQSKRNSFSDMDSPSLRDDMDSIECRIHGLTKKKSAKHYTSQRRCYVHGSIDQGKFLSI